MPSTLRRELARKSLHLASSAVPAAYAAGVPRALVLEALGAALAVAVVVEVTRRRVPWARRAFHGAVGAMLRAHEHDRWSGATWMCAAYLLAVLVFPPAAAVAAMLAVALGDAAAAVVGRAARPPASGDTPGVPPSAGKTWAGSAACFAAAAVGALLVARLPAAAALACGAAAALAERPRGPLDDNLRIAAAAGAAAWGAMWAIARA